MVENRPGNVPVNFDFKVNCSVRGFRGVCINIFVMGSYVKLCPVVMANFNLRFQFMFSHMFADSHNNR